MRRLLVLGALLVAGCAATEPGTPTAGDTTTTTTTTASTSATTSTESAASRPKDIDISGLDVCQVLAALPVADWGLDPASSQGGESSLFPGSQDCYAQGDNIGLTLTAVRDQGAAEYVDGARAEITRTDVGGYPLHVLKPSESSNCFGVLDVHDDQLLFLNYGVNIPDVEPVTPQATLCQRIPAIATAVLPVLGG